MSQHLLAADRLADGHGSQLLHQGYPLGPHAVVVALNKGLGIGLVQGFSGLTVAVAVLAPLTALAAFARLPPLPRIAGALVVGLAYMVASYFAQGAFKETIAGPLRPRLRPRPAREHAAGLGGKLPLRFVPAALIAVGSVYAYSFPGLIWLGGDLRRSGSALEAALRRELPPGRRCCWRWRSSSLVLVAPELGPDDRLPQLRDLRPQRPRPRQPLRPDLALRGARDLALGRLPPRPRRRRRAGARLLPRRRLRRSSCSLYGAWPLLAPPRDRDPRRPRRRRRSPTLAARVGGTPYTAAKAIEIAAPLAPWSSSCPCSRSREFRGTQRPTGSARYAVARPRPRRSSSLAAGVCSLLALANAPVGPTSYSPALTGLRPLVAADSTLVLAPAAAARRRTRRPHTSPGSCAAAASASRPRPKPAARRRPGVRFVVTAGAAGEPPFPRLRLRRVAPPYVLWEATRPGRRPEPLPADRRPPGPPGPSLAELRQSRCRSARQNAKSATAGASATPYVAWAAWRPRPERSPSPCPTASRWSCPPARPGPTPRRRSGPGWPRRRWRSGSAASCATSRRRCPTGPRSRSSPTATPRRWS